MNSRVVFSFPFILELREPTSRLLSNLPFTKGFGRGRTSLFIVRKSVCMFFEKRKNKNTVFQLRIASCRLLHKAEGTDSLALDAAEAEARIVDPPDHVESGAGALVGSAATAEPAPQLVLGPVTARDEEAAAGPQQSEHAVLVGGTRGIALLAEADGVEGALVQHHIPGPLAPYLGERRSQHVPDLELDTPPILLPSAAATASIAILILALIVVVILRRALDPPGELDAPGAVVDAETAAADAGAGRPQAQPPRRGAQELHHLGRRVGIVEPLSAFVFGVRRVVAQLRRIEGVPAFSPAGPRVSRCFLPWLL